MILCNAIMQWCLSPCSGFTETATVLHACTAQTTTIVSTCLIVAGVPSTEVHRHVLQEAPRCHTRQGITTDYPRSLGAIRVQKHRQATKSFGCGVTSGNNDVVGQTQVLLQELHQQDFNESKDLPGAGRVPYGYGHSQQAVPGQGFHFGLWTKGSIVNYAVLRKKGLLGGVWGDGTEQLVSTIYWHGVMVDYAVYFDC